MSRNVLWNIAEVLCSAAALFLTLRIVIQKLGVEALGLWSLVGAIVALSRFAEVGVSAALPSRFNRGDSRDSSTRQWLATALMLNTLSYSALAIVAWALGSFFISQSGRAHADAAAELLGYCAAAFALNGIGGTIGFALIGLRRSDLKSLLTIIGSALQFALAFLFMPALGLKGLALAQISQSALYLVIGLPIVAILLSRAGVWGGRLLPSMTTTRQMFGFGVKVQGLNLAGFLFEPATKFALAHVGGLHLLGLYELASKVIAQARQLAVVPASNLLAVFSAKARHQQLRASYERSVVMLTAAGTALMIGVICASPIFSFLWLGRLDAEFLTISATLAVGWAINISAVAAYYLGVAQNALKWNIVGALVTATSSPAIILTLAPLSSFVPAVIGPAVAIALGAVATYKAADFLMGRASFPIRLIARTRLMLSQLRSKDSATGRILHRYGLSVQ